MPTNRNPKEERKSLIENIFGGDFWALYQHELECEAQGGFAAHYGKVREDCPYPEHSIQWEFWVFGNENEAALIGAGV